MVATVNIICSNGENTMLRLTKDIEASEGFDEIEDAIGEINKYVNYHTLKGNGFSPVGIL